MLNVALDEAESFAVCPDGVPLHPSMMIINSVIKKAGICFMFTSQPGRIGSQRHSKRIGSNADQVRKPRGDDIEQQGHNLKWRTANHQAVTNRGDEFRVGANVECIRAVVSVRRFAHQLLLATGRELKAFRPSAHHPSQEDDEYQFFPFVRVPGVPSHRIE